MSRAHISPALSSPVADHGESLFEQMKAARARLYAATKEIDVIWRARGGMETEAVSSALSRYIDAAKLLPVRANDG